MPPRYRPADQPKASLNFPQAIPWDAANDHVISAAGAAAVATLPAQADAGNTIREIFASYSGAPAAGSTCQIEDGSGNIVWKQAMPASGGWTVFVFDPAKTGTRNTATIITLSAGGGAVIAYLDVNAYIQS
jgi:hypothetical protein